MPRIIAKIAIFMAFANNTCLKRARIMPYTHFFLKEYILYEYQGYYKNKPKGEILKTM